MGKKGTESKREGMEGKRGKRGKEKGERRTGAWEREGQGNGRDGKSESGVKPRKTTENRDFYILRQSKKLLNCPTVLTEIPALCAAHNAAGNYCTVKKPTKNINMQKKLIMYKTTLLCKIVLHYWHV